jgi:hypothetical protein
MKFREARAFREFAGIPYCVNEHAPWSGVLINAGILAKD